VTLKQSDGSKTTIKVPEAVRNLDQVKVGDTLKVKYTEAIALGIRKSNEAPSAVETKTLERAPLGSTPKGEATTTTQVTANIEKINKSKREVTLLQPDGSKTTVVVPQDVKNFDNLKKGDQVVVTATESLALEVVPK
jgi:TusA-related sulfurtransferase